MADVRPLKKGSTTQFAEMGGSDTIPASLIGIVPKFETPSGAVNGSNTAFTLSSTPVANASVIMILDGAVQTNGTDYSVSGTTVTFTTAPASGSEIVAIYNSAASAGGGDFSSNTSSSVDSEIVLFSGTGGKTGKRASGSGYPKLTSGVLSVLTAPQLRSETAANVITPSQITGDQDNYAPTGFADATVVRISGDSSIRAITGFTSSGAYDGQQKSIVNVGSYPVYFPGEHPDSTAANRISSSTDYVLFPGDSVVVVYDSTASRWVIPKFVIPTLASIMFYYMPSGSSTAGDNNQIVFAFVGTGTGAATASTTSVPAHYLFGTASSATAGALAYFSKTSITFSAFGSAHISAFALISIPTLSDATDTYTIEVQITNAPSATALESNNMVGIRYSHGVNSGKWEGFTQDNAGSESVSDLGVTVATDTLYLLEVSIDKARTEARFYINGIFRGRVTGNIPNAVVAGAKTTIVKSVGSATRTMRLHTFGSYAIYS